MRIWDDCLAEAHSAITKSGLLIQKLGQLVQVGIRNVRDGAVFHALPAPMTPLIPLAEAGRMNRSVRPLSGKNNTIDDVLTARIDQRRDVLASENIKTAADQLKTFIRKVFHRRDKSKLAVKPGLHGVIVRRSNVGEMPWLQGANVGVNDLSRCERGGRSAVPRSEEHTSELQSHHDLVCRLLREK